MSGFLGSGGAGGAGSGVSATMLYGDGSDGVAAFDGATTVAGMAPAANVYTMTRDYNFTTITISPGVTVKQKGFKLFGTGTFTNGGTLNNNGNDAATTVIGAQIKGSYGGTGGSAGGSTGTAGGGAGVSGSNGSLGGTGGAGGLGSGGAGAAGGSVVVPGALSGGVGSLHEPLIFILGAYGSSLIDGGTGGGGGGGDATNSGGAGGAGAPNGLLAVKAYVNNGTVSCNGGAGGNATLGNCGGGGGGGGGFYALITNSVTGSIPTVTGGAGGTKTGTGVAGANGGNGTLLQFLNNA